MSRRTIRRTSAAPGKVAARATAAVAILAALSQVAPAAASTGASRSAAAPGAVSARAAAGDVLANDFFARPTNGGWGTADTGGDWVVSPAARFSTSLGRGWIEGRGPGESMTATLDGVAARDVDVFTSFAVDRMASGSGIYASVIARQVSPGDEYRAQVHFTPSGAVQVRIQRVLGYRGTVIGVGSIPDFAYAPMVPVNVRFVVDGSQARVKAWPEGTPEPSGWTVQATDTTARLQASGGVGVMQYLSGSLSDVPVSLSLKDFTVTEVGDAPTSPTTSAPATTPTTAAPTTTPTTAAPTTTPTTAAPTTTTTSPPPPSTTTTTSPPAPPAPAPEDRVASSSGGAGTTVGSASYPVPSGAVVVSPSGNDSASGTTNAPVRTIRRAIQVASSGGTIVLRGGSYHETVAIPSNKRLTVQSYPGETVWLDGSVVVSDWVRDGSTWRYDGWTRDFDTSPTFTRGAADSNQANWGFVNSAYPMAAHPDQIWVDGTALRQVGSRSAVVAGTFYHDRSGNRLYIGSDPSGRTVRVSELQEAVDIMANGSVVRGIGVRRFAPSVPDLGAVVVDADNVVLEHVAVTDGSSTGIFVAGTGVQMRNVYTARHGMIGFRATYADNLTITGMLSEGNNVEHFNESPVSGGAKIARTRTVTVRDSVFRDNDGTGLWFDESSYNLTIVGNEMSGNSHHGSSIEISARLLFADNVVAGNGGWGVKVNDTDQARIWNNTFTGNNGSIWLVQDKRRPGSAPGADPRQPQPDPTVTWVIRSATISNNVVANQVGSQPCIVCVQDIERQRSAEQMGVTLNGNVYNRTAARTPSRLVTWARAGAYPTHYTSLSTYSSATGQERAGFQIDGTAVVTSAGTPTSALPAASSAVALPSDVASAIGVPSGTRRYGAF